MFILIPLNEKTMNFNVHNFYRNGDFSVRSCEFSMKRFNILLVITFWLFIQFIVGLEKKWKKRPVDVLIYWTHRVTMKPLLITQNQFLLEFSCYYGPYTTKSLHCHFFFTNNELFWKNGQIHFNLSINSNPPAE